MSADILDLDLYQDDLKEIINADLPWEKLAGKSLMVSGATGMIGKHLIDAILAKNNIDGLNCKIIALGRNAKKAQNRFSGYFERDDFEFVECDINKEIVHDKADFVIHLASATHPKQYASEPISTITSNIIGLNNLLDFAAKSHSERFIFASSVEIYGENRGDVEKFDEKYLGFIDCNTLRAGYPEGKRAGEALCQAYRAQYGLQIVVPRLARVFGPTMLLDDSKASSQFIKNAVKGEDIVLKSDGQQNYSYLYVTDAVLGILICLLVGEDGEAYNIADEKFDITLRELATKLATIAGSKVIFDLPDADEQRGFSKATKALLDSSKINSLGFATTKNIDERLASTVKLLSQVSL